MTTITIPFPHLVHFIRRPSILPHRLHRSQFLIEKTPMQDSSSFGEWFGFRFVSGYVHRGWIPAESVKVRQLKNLLGSETAITREKRLHYCCRSTASTSGSRRQSNATCETKERAHRSGDCGQKNRSHSCQVHVVFGRCKGIVVRE